MYISLITFIIDNTEMYQTHVSLLSVGEIKWMLRDLTACKMMSTMQG